MSASCSPSQVNEAFLAGANTVIAAFVLGIILVIVAHGLWELVKGIYATGKRIMVRFKNKRNDEPTVIVPFTGYHMYVAEKYQPTDSEK